jgi:hypothetical protein
MRIEQAVPDDYPGHERGAGRVGSAPRAGRGRSLLAAAAGLALAALANAACDHAWDEYDPRLAVSAASAGTAAGGGTATSAVTSSSSGGGASSTASVGSSNNTATSTTGGGGAGGAPTTCAPNGTTELTDDFDDMSIGAVWTPYVDGNVAMTQAGGELVIDVLAGEIGFAALLSTASYDLTGCQVSVEVTSVTTGKGYNGLAVSTDLAFSSYVEIVQYSDALHFNAWMGGVKTELAAVSYDPNQHAWWRLRESGGMLYWEVSPDGQAFASLGSTPAPFSLSAVHVVLTAGSSGPAPVPAAGSAHYDNLNLPP